MEELRTDSGDIVFIGSAKQHAVKRRQSPFQRHVALRNAVPSTSPCKIFILRSHGVLENLTTPYNRRDNDAMCDRGLEEVNSMYLYHISTLYDMSVFYIVLYIIKKKNIILFLFIFWWVGVLINYIP